MSVGLVTRGMICPRGAGDVVAEKIEVDVEEVMTTDDVEISSASIESDVEEIMTTDDVEVSAVEAIEIGIVDDTIEIDVEDC